MIEDLIAEAIGDIPANELVSSAKEYDTQGGACKVWVTEQFIPGVPKVSNGSITFPYHVNRPDHQYNCTNGIRSSDHTEGPVDASFDSKVTANYVFEDGKLSVFNIKDHGKSEETIGGKAILKKLEDVS